jgi:hypothetical protein
MASKAKGRKSAAGKTMKSKVPKKKSRAAKKSPASKPLAKKTKRRMSAAPRAAPKTKSAARRGGRGGLDFGIEPKRAVGRAAETTQPRAGAESRVAGVGGQEAGPGSYSGGDIDPSIVGVGTGGTGVSQAGPERVEPSPARDDEDRDEGDEDEAFTIT